jgi:hypothetical protein
MVNETDLAERIWDTVELRAREMLACRRAGLTLEDIGRQHGLTRERVRQVILKAEGQLAVAGSIWIPDWHKRLIALKSVVAIPTSAIAEILSTQDQILIDIFSTTAGFEPVAFWGGKLQEWRTADSGTLKELFDTVVTAAPMRVGDLESYASTLGLAELPLATLLTLERSPLVQDADGNWLRRRFLTRDAAYMQLLERGEPCSIDELATAVATSKLHSLREALRKDTRFKQIRPEGTWTLTEWTHIDATPYANAVEAMVGVVSELGPLSKEALFARVTERYPVSSWRLQQCLLSDEIGATSEGLIDLVKRGATPVEDREPAQPATMTSDAEGKILGIRLTVNHELLRGSGVNVSPWITWKLGLRHAPMAKTFDTIDGSKPLTIKRMTSAAQISTLRQHALAQGAAIGCGLILLLHVDDSTARIVHACALGTCKASDVTPDPPTRKSLSMVRGHLASSVHE